MHLAFDSSNHKLEVSIIIPIHNRNHTKSSDFLVGSSESLYLNPSIKESSNLSFDNHSK